MVFTVVVILIPTLTCCNRECAISFFSDVHTLEEDPRESYIFLGPYQKTRYFVLDRYISKHFRIDFQLDTSSLEVVLVDVVHLWCSQFIPCQKQDWLVSATAHLRSANPVKIYSLMSWNWFRSWIVVIVTLRFKTISSGILHCLKQGLDDCLSRMVISVNVELTT